MKLLDSLFEEFLTGVKHSEEYYEIYVNPTLSELETLKKSSKYYKVVRATLDNKRKKVFAFPGVLIHNEVDRHIETNQFEKKKDYLFIHFYVEDGVLDFGSDSLSSSTWYSKNQVKAILKNDWSWAEKYLPGLKEWLDKMKFIFKVEE